MMTTTTLPRVKPTKKKKYLAWIYRDVSSLKLWRYKDPVVGPRKIPSPGDHEGRCAALPGGGVLQVDVAAGRVALAQNGTSLDLGTQLVYTYEK